MTAAVLAFISLFLREQRSITLDYYVFTSPTPPSPGETCLVGWDLMMCPSLLQRCVQRHPTRPDEFRGHYMPAAALNQCANNLY
uniref:Putative secreted protein n=1 Tax=Anopheles darlingi TaxID=43151 RepID=A0A2M4D419_ANODA